MIGVEDETKFAIAITPTTLADDTPGSSYGIGIDNIDRRSSIGHVILLDGEFPTMQSRYVTIPQQASVKAESSISVSIQRRAKSMLADTSR